MAEGSTSKMTSSRLGMPEPGKIHKLPVKIIYHLIPLPLPSSPSSSTTRNREQTFLTFPTAPLSAFTHPVPRSRKGKGREQDASLAEPMWASVYLKGIVGGICLASPELDPAFASSLSSSSSSSHPAIDHSLHILDPYQTHIQSLSTPSTHEVWTGRGLFSTALSEPGEGKTMLKAKLIRDPQFGLPTSSPDSPGQEAEEGGLEGLMRSAMAAQEEDEELESEGGGWGVEVHMRLRAIDPAQLARLSPQNAVKQSSTPRPAEASTSDSKTPTEAIRQKLQSTNSWDLVKGDRRLEKVMGGFDEGKLREVVFGGGSTDVGSSRRRVEAAVNLEATSTVDYSDSAYPTSPLPGGHSSSSARQPLVAKDSSPVRVKRYRTSPGMRKKKQPIKPGVCCSNCGRVETVTWRMRGEQRVCNACGIYWNQKKAMRPKELWGRPLKGDTMPPAKVPTGGVLIGGRYSGGKWLSPTTVDSENPDLPNEGHQGSTPVGKSSVGGRSPMGSGAVGEFRRTLTTFVEKESERLREKKGVGKGGERRPKGGERRRGTGKEGRDRLGTLPINIPAGSPFGPGRHHPYYQNPHPNVQSSSYQHQHGRPHQTSPYDNLTPEQQLELLTSLQAVLQPVPESPGTALRKLLAYSDAPGGMSMDLPLSDDSRGTTNSATKTGPSGAVAAGRNNEDVDMEMETLSAFFKFSASQESRESQRAVGGTVEGVGLGSGMDVGDPTSMEFKAVSEGGSPSDPFSFFDVNPSSEQAGPSSPFDFSQLPPSSPPVDYDDAGMGLGHSALLLSSPEDQMGVGSVGTESYTPWTDDMTTPAEKMGWGEGMGMGDGVGAGMQDFGEEIKNMSEEEILALLAQEEA